MAVIQDFLEIYIEGVGDNVVEDMWGTDDDGKLHAAASMAALTKREDLVFKRFTQLKTF